LDVLVLSDGSPLSRVCLYPPLLDVFCSKREITHFIYIAHVKNSSKLKDNQQINDVIQVCFILEGYHQRGPTHPTEDTDRSSAAAGSSLM
jgi:hypothetical protein